MGGKWFIAFFFLLGGFFVPSFAADLLNRAQPPTSLELLESFKRFPRKNPWQKAKTPEQEVFIQTGIDMIAALEKAYPGAVWAPLGRDAGIAADFLDAFYTVNGYPKRVSRLRASTKTILHERGANIIRFLESAGANFNPKKKTVRPFVILDRTTFSPNSQSTILLKEAFSEWVKRGGKPEAFPYRFGVVNLTPFHEVVADSKNDARSLLYEQGRALSLYPHVSGLGIFSVDGLVDGPAWHDTYGYLTTYKDGFYGVPGKPEPAGQMEILQNHYEFLKAARSKTFLLAVKKSGAKMGHVMDFQNILSYQRTSGAASKQFQFTRLKYFLEGKINYWFPWPSNDNVLADFLDEKFRSQHQAFFKRLIRYKQFQDQWADDAMGWFYKKPGLPDEKQIFFYVSEILADRPEPSFVAVINRILADTNFVLISPIAQKWLLQCVRHPSIAKLVRHSVFQIINTPHVLVTAEGRKLFLELVPYMKEFNMFPYRNVFDALEFRYPGMAEWAASMRELSLEGLEMVAKNKKLSQDFIEGKNTSKLCETVLSKL